MRISCCIPLCKRTKLHVAAPVNVDGREVDLGAEWICPTHWAAVPKSLKREHSAGKREVRRVATFASNLASYQIWQRCKSTAADIAFGLR